MKKGLLWFWLFQKRIWKKRMFQVTVALIPVILLVLHTLTFQKASMINVAVYTGGDEGTLSDELLKGLLEQSGGVITFYRSETEDALYADVHTGKAECGYIIPQELEKTIQGFENGKMDGNKIKVVRKEESVTTGMINEMVFGKVYPYVSYEIVSGFLEKQQKEHMQEPGAKQALAENFEAWREPELMFTFSYADGTENKLLTEQKSNYYMMPVRGILAVFIVITGMAGVLMLYEDDKKGMFSWIVLQKRNTVFYLYSLIPVCTVGILSLFVIFLTGLFVGIGRECLLMLGYVLLCAGFCNLLRVFSPNIYAYAVLLPVMALANLLLCPVFVDAGAVHTGLSVIQKVLPVSWYLNAVYSNKGRIVLLVVAVLVSGGSILLDRIVKGGKA